MNDSRTDKTGAKIEVRLMRSDDEQRLHSFYEGLSDETLRSYCRYTANRKYYIQRTMITLECNVDSEKYLYMIAISGDEIVGIGMLGRWDSFLGTNYEVSHLITDEYQSHGIGSILMEEMLAYAKIHMERYSLIARTAPCNYRAKGLLKKFGFVFEKTLSDHEESFWSYKM